MILNAIVANLKRRAKADFQGRHFEAGLIVQAVSWYLRYPLSYRDIEELFLERGVEVDHSTLNRWVLAYAPLIEKRLRLGPDRRDVVSDRCLRSFLRYEAGSARTRRETTSLRRRSCARPLHCALDEIGR